MYVIKKLNNNVAVCVDNNGRELVAFGKGIGFGKLPYELTDLNKIERTFYNVDDKMIPLLKDIPGDVVTFTASLMEQIQGKLPYEITPNTVLTMADHIAFAIQRAEKGVYIKLPSIYELEPSYPQEIRIGRMFVSAINKKYRIRLPKDEIQGIAMHLINAANSAAVSDKQNNPDARQAAGSGSGNGQTPGAACVPEKNLGNSFDEVLEEVTQIVEFEMNLHVRRDSFNYARFATHVKYLVDRLVTEQYIDTDNIAMFKSMRKEYADVARCVDRINKYFKEDWNVEMSEEEQLYLIMHINRVCAKENDG